MLGSDIKNLVIVKMEEYSPFGQDGSEPILAGGDILSEVKPIYSYIDANIVEAANEMLLICPLHRLTSIATDVNNAVVIQNISDGSIGTITKPNDWLRLHTLQMQGWRRPVHDVVFKDNPLYIYQFTEWTRGTAQKPIVTDDGNTLSYYSQPDKSGVIVKFSYIKLFNLTINYPLEVAELIALNTASKVNGLFGNIEQVKQIQAEIQSDLQIMSN